MNGGQERRFDTYADFGVPPIVIVSPGGGFIGFLVDTVVGSSQQLTGAAILLVVMVASPPFSWLVHPLILKIVISVGKLSVSIPNARQKVLPHAWLVHSLAGEVIFCSAADRSPPVELLGARLFEL